MLEIKDLFVSYGMMEVLHGISLKVEDKELVSVIGPNGAGKSTLIKTVMGLVKPTSGTILYNGQAGLVDLDCNRTQSVLSAYFFAYNRSDWGMFTAQGLPKEGQTLEEVRDILLAEVAKLRAGDFKIAASTMGLTEVQYRRISGKVIADVEKHLNEAIGRSFLSDDFVARLRALVAATLSVLR